MTDQRGHINRYDGVRSGYLGLQLTAGALALIGATWLFGGVAEDVVHGDPLILIDVGFRAGRSHTWMTGTALYAEICIKSLMYISQLCTVWVQSWLHSP